MAIQQQEQGLPGRNSSGGETDPLKKIEAEITAKVQEHAPQNFAAFKKAVLAGDKIMFDPKTHQNMELVKNPATRSDPVNTIAKGVSGLMWLMYQQSRQTMDLQVMITAGIVLMTHAIDFAERGLGIQFDGKMIGDATQTLAYLIMKRLGISPEQLGEAIQKGAGEIKQQQGGQQPQQPTGSGMLAQQGGV
jgi:hypothetical protein